ncbi:MAG: site-specific integrase, partial [Saprospiraceae bacterium]
RHPLKLLVVVNRNPIRISLGHSLHPKDWNGKLQSVRNSCKDFDNLTRFNNWLQSEKSKVLSKLVKLEESGNLNRLSANDIKNNITQKNTEVMTLEFFSSVINEMETAKRFGNARVYMTVSRSIASYMKGKDFPLKQITYTWLKKYESWYLSRGNTLNGLSVNIRTLRSLYNIAIKQSKITQEYYPFADYSIRTEETRKRAISREDLIKFLQFKPVIGWHSRAKDYFLISFYLMGASFIDISFLKIKNIINGRIEYKRQKTGKLHSIPVSNQLMSILNGYMKGKKENEFILNIIHSTDPKKQLVEIRDELRRYNRTLKEIGELCGIESKISSYVARHSYATNAKKLGVPTAIISEALGHTTEKMTQVYLDSFENNTVDAYHTQIINL